MFPCSVSDCLVCKDVDYHLPHTLEDGLFDQPPEPQTPTDRNTFLNLARLSDVDSEGAVDEEELQPNANRSNFGNKGMPFSGVLLFIF